MNKRGHIILGHPRSGTTLLRRLLGGHSNIATPPETHLFSSLARFLERDPTAHGLEMGALTGLEFCGFSKERVLGDLREFAFKYLDEYTQNQNKSLWIEKTAFDTFHIPTIEELCGDTVSYIGIIRHPLDVAISAKEFCDNAGAYPKSMHSYLKACALPIEAFVNSWIDTTEALLELGQRQPENCIICRYEDLVEDPELILEEIVNGIGETYESQMVELAFKNHDTIGLSDYKSYQNTGVHTNSLKKWETLPRRQIATLAPKIQSLLETCGYDPIPEEFLSIEDYTPMHYVSGLQAYRDKKE